jgi:anti-sigma B factor antagonist
VKASPFEIGSERQAGTGRLTLIGELDLATVPRVEQAVQELLVADVQRLIVDLSGLSFIDPSGLGLLIALDKRATEECWALDLIRPSEQVLTVFQIGGAEENLPFIEDRGSA